MEKLPVQFFKKTVRSDASGYGVPSFVLIIGGDNEKAPSKLLVSDIMQDLLSDKLRNIFIVGNLDENPEIVTLLKGLTLKGKSVTFQTRANSTIGPIRILKNLKLSVFVDDFDSEKSDLSSSNLMLLRLDDELILNVDSIRKYNSFKEYFKGRPLVAPVIQFKVSKDVSVKDFEDIRENFLEECSLFPYRSKLIQVQ